MATAKITVTYPDASKETFPSVAALADAFGDYKEQRLTADKVAASIKERESALSAALIEHLPKSDATGVAGKSWLARVVTKPKAVLDDFDALWTWATKNKRSDMLQRRLNEAAVKELWDAGKAVPGVGKIEVATVSLSKVKA